MPAKKIIRNAPVTTRPIPCNVTEMLNLSQIAYSIGKNLGWKQGFTVSQVVGAIRSLELKHVQGKYSVTVNGCMISKQQTMIHRSQIGKIQRYLKEKLENLLESAPMKKAG